MPWWIYGVIGGFAGLIYDFIRPKLRKHINNLLVLRLIAFACTCIACFCLYLIVHFTIGRYFNWDE